MAGLLPERRTREELERANATLLEKHWQHLQSWVAHSKMTISKDNSDPARNQNSKSVVAGSK